METSNTNTEQQLWELAKQRAHFKKNLTSYFLVNSFLVVVWFFSNYNRDGNNYFWPIWPILGWGIGIVTHYLSAYQSTKFFSVENEYKKLKDKAES